MIFIGYQGIGKSTLAHKYIQFIDLESGNFYYSTKTAASRIRPEYWYIYYCNIAKSLSEQGYDVFVSSHAEVRQTLVDNCDEPVVAIYPIEALKDAWIQKLKERYEYTQWDGHYRAYKNAEDRYVDNIQEIRADIVNHIEIDSMDYNLYDLIRKYQQHFR